MFFKKGSVFGLFGSVDGSFSDVLELLFQIKDEWKVFAKVIDRLLIIVYMSVIVIGSLVIFLQVPSIRQDGVDYVKSSLQTAGKKLS